MSKKKGIRSEEEVLGSIVNMWTLKENFLKGKDIVDREKEGGGGEWRGSERLCSYLASTHCWSDLKEGLGIHLQPPGTTLLQDTHMD